MCCAHTLLHCLLLYAVQLTAGMGMDISRPVSSSSNANNSSSGSSMPAQPLQQRGRGGRVASTAAARRFMPAKDDTDATAGVC
jgi:hypothetical protein